LKRALAPIDRALDKLTSLTGYTFTMDVADKGPQRCAGLLAQEVQRVLPEVVSAGPDGMLSLAYGNMLGLVVEAFKEQQYHIRSLAAQVTALEAEVQGLRGVAA
jgi:hypothetical protein